MLSCEQGLSFALFGSGAWRGGVVWLHCWTACQVVSCGDGIVKFFGQPLSQGLEIRSVE